jgi:hypothetical protein
MEFHCRGHHADGAAPELHHDLQTAVESLDHERINAVIAKIGMIDAKFGHSCSCLADEFDDLSMLDSPLAVGKKNNRFPNV